MDNTKDFIINILFIFSPLVFYPYVHRFRGDNPRLFRFLMFVLVAVSLVTTMTFPIDANGLSYDMRSIALTLGILYCGPWWGGLLFLTAVGYRHLMDYPNTLEYAISLAPSFFFVLLLFRVLGTFTTMRKALLSVVASTMIKVITLTLYLLTEGRLSAMYENPGSTLVVYAIQGIIMACTVYLIEFLTRHYQLQEEVLRSEKAAIVSNMAASVAHEIRNPLTAVRGFIQLLGSDSIAPDKKHYYRNICLEELDRAQQIISDYLSLAGPGLESIERIEINEELHYVANVLQTLAHLNNAEIVREPHPSPSPYISGDRSKFRQALINICKNAIEAMPNGGELFLKACSANGRVTLTIADNGAGMTAEQVQRLGTPYFSTKDKGTGLGTMVSFNIIRKMNGRIDVRSAPGKGTTFELEFPPA